MEEEDEEEDLCLPGLCSGEQIHGGEHADVVLPGPRPNQETPFGRDAVQRAPALRSCLSQTLNSRPSPSPPSVRLVCCIMSATASSEPSTILITGANSGIGLAASKLFALKESTKRVILGR